MNPRRILLLALVGGGLLLAASSWSGRSEDSDSPAMSADRPSEPGLPNREPLQRSPSPLPAEGEESESTSPFEEGLERYRQFVADETATPEFQDALAQAATRYAQRIEEMRRAHPELEGYPFLDPTFNAPGDTRFTSVFQQAVGDELGFLARGTSWDDSFGAMGEERSREASRAFLEDPRRLAGLPPSVLASMPGFGNVPPERIRERLLLLQSLRLDYLEAVYPLLLEKSIVSSWWHRNETKPELLPPELRMDLSEDAPRRLAEIDAQIEPYRVRYLRAVGEAIGATELPPLD